MASDKKIKESESEAEKVKRKVDKMYENYGIIIDPSSEGDLTTVYKHYYENRDELEADYEKSKQHIGHFDEDDAI